MIIIIHLFLYDPSFPVHCFVLVLLHPLVIHSLFTVTYTLYSAKGQSPFFFTLAAHV